MDWNQKKLEELRRENALKSLYYRRYFLVRYATMASFFVSLYWTMAHWLTRGGLGLVFPFFLLLAGGVAIWEQGRLFSQQELEPKWTRRYHQLVVLGNGLLVTFLLMGQAAVVFPFFTLSWQGLVLILIGLLIGTWVHLFVLKRLDLIQQGQDRQSLRIKHYLTTSQ